MLPIEIYLVLYGAVFVCTFIACWFAVSRADRTDRLPALPIPPQLDPYELASLRGGKSAVEHLAILELLDGGYLCARHQKASFWRCLRTPSTILEKVREGRDLPWHLSAALERFTTPQELDKYENLWGGQWPRPELEERLKKERLFVTEEVECASRTAGIVSLVVLGASLIPGFFFMRPLEVIGIWIWVSFGLILGACETGRLSKRGKAYLKRLQRAYRGKPASAAALATTAGGASVALGISFALFGAESLKDTPYEDLGESIDAGDSGDGGDGGGDD